ncbi:MAG TPA: hypothetical protein VFE62_10040 [Gemmataceae bacterium]|nr:hypothetical protein [Gemmataceae bacterium]
MSAVILDSSSAQQARTFAHLGALVREITIHLAKTHMLPIMQEVHHLQYFFVSALEKFKAVSQRVRPQQRTEWRGRGILAILTRH